MILSRRNREEETFLRKVMILVRISADKSIKTQEDVSKYVSSMYKDLGFKETRDIMLAWTKIRENPYHYSATVIAEELANFYLPD